MSAISSKILSIEVDTFFTHIGLLILVGAILALAIGVSDRTHSYDVTYFNRSDLLAYNCDLADHLMAHAGRVNYIT